MEKRNKAHRLSGRILVGKHLKDACLKDKVGQGRVTLSHGAVTFLKGFSDEGVPAGN
jgi:hypothetical protein